VPSRDGEAAEYEEASVSDSIENFAEREACIGKVPGPIDLKIIDHLDEGARRWIATDAAVREWFSVARKTPLLATCIAQPALSVRESTALPRAGLWTARSRAEGIDPAAMFVAHIKHSKARGLQAKLARAAVSLPGLMEKGL